MALSDVIKKKQATGNEKENKSAIKKNPLDDVRIVIAILIIACIALIVLIVFSSQSINDTLTSIDEVKQDYQDNQTAIANLMALQSKSAEYEAQRDEYNSMISSDGLDELKIMIDMESDVEAHNCTLSSIDFAGGTTDGSASTASTTTASGTSTGIGATSSAGVKQMQVMIKISGKYEDIMKFANDTVNSHQIKRIDTIKMTEETGEDGLKTADLVVVLFSK